MDDPTIYDERQARQRRRARRALIVATLLLVGSLVWHMAPTAWAQGVPDGTGIGFVDAALVKVAAFLYGAVRALITIILAIPLWFVTKAGLAFAAWSDGTIIPLMVGTAVGPVEALLVALRPTMAAASYLALLFAVIGYLVRSFGGSNKLVIPERVLVWAFVFSTLAGVSGSTSTYGDLLRYLEGDNLGGSGAGLRNELADVLVVAFLGEQEVAEIGYQGANVVEEDVTEWSFSLGAEFLPGHHPYLPDLSPSVHDMAPACQRLEHGTDAGGSIEPTSIAARFDCRFPTPEELTAQNLTIEAALGQLMAVLADGLVRLVVAIPAGLVMMLFSIVKIAFSVSGLILFGVFPFALVMAVYRPLEFVVVSLLRNYVSLWINTVKMGGMAGLLMVVYGMIQQTATFAGFGQLAMTALWGAFTVVLLKRLASEAVNVPFGVLTEVGNNLTSAVAVTGLPVGTLEGTIAAWKGDQPYLPRFSLQPPPDTEMTEYVDYVPQPAVEPGSPPPPPPPAMPPRVESVPASHYETPADLPPSEEAETAPPSPRPQQAEAGTRRGVRHAGSEWTGYPTNEEVAQDRARYPELDTLYRMSEEDTAQRQANSARSASPEESAPPEPVTTHPRSSEALRGPEAPPPSEGASSQTTSPQPFMARRTPASSSRPGGSRETGPESSADSTDAAPARARQAPDASVRMPGTSTTAAGDGIWEAGPSGQADSGSSSPTIASGARHHAPATAGGSPPRSPLLPAFPDQPSHAQGEGVSASDRVARGGTLPMTEVSASEVAGATASPGSYRSTPATDAKDSVARQVVRTGVRAIMRSEEAGRLRKMVGETMEGIPDEQWEHLHKLVPLWEKWEQASPEQRQQIRERMGQALDLTVEVVAQTPDTKLWGMVAQEALKEELARSAEVPEAVVAA